jgi:hypothetical protein
VKLIAEVLLELIVTNQVVNWMGRGLSDYSDASRRIRGTKPLVCREQVAEESAETVKRVLAGPPASDLALVNSGAKSLKDRVLRERVVLSSERVQPFRHHFCVTLAQGCQSGYDVAVRVGSQLVPNGPKRRALARVVRPYY